MTDTWSPETQRPFPGHLRPVARRRLFVRHAPPAGPLAEPAVMVHGLGGQSMNWTDLMALLRHRLDAVAPDLPGFGRSGPPDDGDYSLDAMVDAVRGLVEQHGEPVHLFGNSMGGAVAVRLAARHPGLVRSLVLVSPALPDLRPRRSVLAVPALAVPGLGTRIWERVARLPPERQVQAMLALTFGDPATVPAVRRDEAVAEYRRRFALPYAGDALSRATRGLLRAYLDPGPGGLWREAGRLSVPTLLVYGGCDRLVDPRRAHRTAATVGSAWLVVIPEAGHVAQMEQPLLVAAAVERFLERLPDR